LANRHSSTKFNDKKKLARGPLKRKWTDVSHTTTKEKMNNDTNKNE